MRLRKPTCKHVEITRGITSWEIIASMEFKVCLFDDGDPQFTSSRVSTRPVTVLASGEIIINGDSPPATVNKQFYNVFASWVVGWVPMFVLGIDIVRD